MSRKLRFEYPGAIYHIINRGNYRSRIFQSEGAKKSFEKTLFEACEYAGWNLHANLVMSDQYHLALETPEPNLSAGMRYNNVQPVLRPDGSAVDGMLLFYGWNDERQPDGVAFLLDEPRET